MASGIELQSPKPITGGSVVDAVGPHAAKIMLGAAAVGLIAVFLPAVTVTVFGTSVSVKCVGGWQGKLGLVAYLAVGAMAGMALAKSGQAPSKNVALAGLITAGVAVLLAFLLWMDVGRASSVVGDAAELGAGVSTGIGVYLNLAAAAVMAAGAFVQFRRG